jgi:hypothetical protein
MDVLLVWIGRLVGLAGVLLCAVAVYSRVTSSYFIGGFQVGTVLQAGTTAILAGCFCLLIVLTSRPRP